MGSPSDHPRDFRIRPRLQSRIPPPLHGLHVWAALINAAVSRIHIDQPRHRNDLHFDFVRARFAHSCLRTFRTVRGLIRTVRDLALVHFEPRRRRPDSPVGKSLFAIVRCIEPAAAPLCKSACFSAPKAGRNSGRFGKNSEGSQVDRVNRQPAFRGGWKSRDVDAALTSLYDCGALCFAKGRHAGHQREPLSSQRADG